MNYPRGKFKDDDEGSLAIGIFVRDKTVIIDFMKEVAWIGMDKSQSIEFANAILEKANSI